MRHFKTKIKHRLKLNDRYHPRFRVELTTGYYLSAPINRWLKHWTNYVSEPIVKTDEVLPDHGFFMRDDKLCYRQGSTIYIGLEPISVESETPLNQSTEYDITYNYTEVQHG